MRPGRLTLAVGAALVLLPLVPCAALAWRGSAELRAVGMAAARDGLEARARMIEPEARRLLDLGDPGRLDALVKTEGAADDTRLTVIARDGTVLAESELDPAGMADHSNRPEVIAALAGNVGTDLRTSPTLGRPMLYVAVPVRPAGGDGPAPAVVRAAMPAPAVFAPVDAARARLVWTALTVGGAASLAVLLACLWLGRRYGGALGEMRHAALTAARTGRRRRLPEDGPRDVARLAHSLNLVLARLENRIARLAEERNQRDALLGAMVEGVLSVDADERLQRINPAAAALLDLPGDPDALVGRSLPEAVRNPSLRQFVLTALGSGGVTEGRVIVRPPGEEGERVLQAHGTPLPSASGGPPGALVVLHDVTRLERLERVRQDFVANVSHELRTPITTIKGWLETLQDGAFDDPDQAERFLDRALTQADGLVNIINDLLSLSRLEREGPAARIEVEEADPAATLDAVVRTCAARAEERGVTIESRAEAPRARYNPQLIEQALVNLVDNAVRYGREGGTVRLTARARGPELVFHVADDGPGIAPEHLGRLFERFYRVDTARSRSLGGTGLGLAIVKHIAQVHGGTVSADSVLGRGSLFTVRIPLLAPV